MKKKDVHCPYCGKKAFIKEGTFVYGENKHTSYLYVCSGYPECDSYVGVHKKSLQPLGVLANATLRRKRIEAHRAFDTVWKTGIMPKKQAYMWMQDKFCLNSDQAHIGVFGEYMCDQLIQETETVLINNSRRQVAI